MFYLLKVQSTHRMISTPFLSSAEPQEHPDMHLSHTQYERSATELTKHSEYLQKPFSDVEEPSVGANMPTAYGDTALPAPRGMPP